MPRDIPGGRMRTGPEAIEQFQQRMQQVLQIQPQFMTPGVQQAAGQAATIEGLRDFARIVPEYKEAVNSLIGALNAQKDAIVDEQRARVEATKSMTSSVRSLATTISTATRVPGIGGLISGLGRAGLGQRAQRAAAGQMGVPRAILGGMGIAALTAGLPFALSLFRKMWEIGSQINRTFMTTVNTTGRIGQGLEISARQAAALRETANRLSADFGISARDAAKISTSIAEMGIAFEGTAGEEWQRMFIGLY